MTDVGDIHSLDAYIRGKLLDHSSWQKGESILPRGVTPSDVDIVWDNRGFAILGELSSQFSEWRSLDKGQREMYEALITGDRHVAALLRHHGAVYNGKKIDSRFDVLTFQIMFWHGGRVHITKVFNGRERWNRFVFGWYENSQAIRDWFIEHEIPENVSRETLAMGETPA